jgi:hypothetical protein
MWFFKIKERQQIFPTHDEKFWPVQDLKAFFYSTAVYDVVKYLILIHYFEI